MKLCGNAFAGPRISSMSLVILNIFLLTLLLLLTGCAGVTSTPVTPPGGGGGGGGGGGTASDQTLKTEDVATNLDNPWSLVFAPDGRLFFTETPGRIRVVTSSGLVSTPVLDISSQTQEGEAGTTGMDIDPNFAANGFL